SWCSPLDDEGAFEQTCSAQVAVPPLVVPLLDEAVATEQLDTARADPGRVRRGEPARVGDDLGRVLAGAESAGGLPDREPERVELDRDVGDREGDGLSVSDRLAEGGALLDIGDHLVQDRRSGAHGAGRPGEPGPADGVAVVLGRAQEVLLRDL